MTYNYFFNSKSRFYYRFLNLLLTFFLLQLTHFSFAGQTDQPKQKLPVLGNPHNMLEQKKFVGGNTPITDYKKLKHISAKSAIIIDVDSGQILYAKQPDLPRQPASTIKVLTGIIALEKLKPEEPVAVSKNAAKQPRSKLYLDRKKHYMATDLINGILLGSANDASVAIAEKIAGTEKNFALDMTKKAHSWGARKTVCLTASGLTAKGQQSTARDLALIFKHAMQNSNFVERMAKNRIKTSYGQTIYTHNKALWTIHGAVAGKTGYTNAARQTYVGQFQKDDAKIIVAIMGSETMWKDVKHLVQHGISKRLALDTLKPHPESPIASYKSKTRATENSPSYQN